MIKTMKMIYRSDLKNNPNCLFVFGDNMVRKGFGGQAREMRGEPNSVGIPTKKYPSMNENSFLRDKDFEAWKEASLANWRRLFEHARLGGDIVLPKDGIGTGLARLEYTSPVIWASLNRNITALMGVSS